MTAQSDKLRRCGANHQFAPFCRHVAGLPEAPGTVGCQLSVQNQPGCEGYCVNFQAPIYYEAHLKDFLETSERALWAFGTLVDISVKVGVQGQKGPIVPILKLTAVSRLVYKKDYRQFVFAAPLTLSVFSICAVMIFNRENSPVWTLQLSIE